MREDVITFNTHGVLPRGTNASFITSVPKIDEPLNLGDFRPISLVGCIYKILSKLLANRLKKMLKGVTDNKQSAFFLKLTMRWLMTR